MEICARKIGTKTFYFPIIKVYLILYLRSNKITVLNVPLFLHYEGVTWNAYKVTYNNNSNLQHKVTYNTGSRFLGSLLLS
jgi:hypothetical protein